jgi:hypothetical protein
MKRKNKITEAGQACRHCQTSVIRQEHRDLAEKLKGKQNRGGFYYLWWLKCPRCKALYMIDTAKRYYDGRDAFDTTPASAFVPPPQPNPIRPGWEPRAAHILPWE